MTREGINPIGNQQGSIMVIALLIMATLAVAGLLVTNDAVTESQVGRNYAIQKQTVSAAEGAAKELIQAIDNLFQDALTSQQAVGDFNDQTWRPYDDYNRDFDFDPESLRDGTYNQVKLSNLEGNIGYLANAGAIAVLVDQTTAIMDPSLGGMKVPEHFVYVIYSRALHEGAGNAEAILMIGYRQEFTKS